MKNSDFQASLYSSLNTVRDAGELDLAELRPILEASRKREDKLTGFL